ARSLWTSFSLVRSSASTRSLRLLQPARGSRSREDRRQRTGRRPPVLCLLSSVALLPTWYIRELRSARRLRHGHPFQHLIDQPELHRLGGGQEVVAVGLALDDFQRLARMLGHQLI